MTLRLILEGCSRPPTCLALHNMPFFLGVTIRNHVFSCIRVPIFLFLHLRHSCSLVSNFLLAWPILTWSYPAMLPNQVMYLCDLKRGDFFLVMFSCCSLLFCAVIPICQQIQTRIASFRDTFSSNGSFWFQMSRNNPNRFVFQSILTFFLVFCVLNCTHALNKNCIHVPNKRTPVRFVRNVPPQSQSLRFSIHFEVFFGLLRTKLYSRPKQKLYSRPKQTSNGSFCSEFPATISIVAFFNPFFFWFFKLFFPHVRGEFWYIG